MGTAQQFRTYLLAEVVNACFSRMPLIPLIRSPGLPGSSAQNEFGLGPVRFETHSFRAIRSKQLLKTATNFVNVVSDDPTRRPVPACQTYGKKYVNKLTFACICPHGVEIRSISISHSSY
jgi:hypothetical protein